MTINKIFVSHSSFDKKIVDSFVNNILIGSFEVPQRNIFYTSGEGMGIETGEEWRSFIRGKLLSSDIIILVITSNYKSSEICMNEMGASWASDAYVLPVIIKPINYKNIGVLSEVNQAVQLNSDTGLDNIYSLLVGEKFNMSTPIQARWSTQKFKFLGEVEKIVTEFPFPEPISKDTIQKLERELTEVKAINQTLIEDVKINEKYIKVLESKKDMEDIKSAKREAGLMSKVEEFEKITDELNSILKKLNIIVVTYVFNDYTDKNLQVDYNTYKKEIETARAQEYINEDGKINWTSTSIMEKLYNKLETLSQCIEDLDANSFELLNDKYSTLNTDNLTFWEKALGTNVIK